MQMNMFLSALSVSVRAYRQVHVSMSKRLDRSDSRKINLWSSWKQKQSALFAVWADFSGYVCQITLDYGRRILKIIWFQAVNLPLTMALRHWSVFQFMSCQNWHGKVVSEDFLRGGGGFGKKWKTIKQRFRECVNHTQCSYTHVHNWQCGSVFLMIWSFRSMIVCLPFLHLNSQILSATRCNCWRSEKWEPSMVPGRAWCGHSSKYSVLSTFCW